MFILNHCKEKLRIFVWVFDRLFNCLIIWFLLQITFLWVWNIWIINFLKVGIAYVIPSDAPLVSVTNPVIMERLNLFITNRRISQLCSIIIYLMVIYKTKLPEVNLTIVFRKIFCICTQKKLFKVLVSDWTGCKHNSHHEDELLCFCKSPSSTNYFRIWDFP